MKKDLSALKLKLLEDGGVDNWIGYEESLGRFYEYEEYVDGLSDEEEILPYEDWLEMPDVRFYEMKVPVQMEVFDGSDYMIRKYGITGYGLASTSNGIEVDEEGYFTDSSGNTTSIEYGDAITTDKRGKHYLIRKEDFINNYKEVEA